MMKATRRRNKHSSHHTYLLFLRRIFAEQRANEGEIVSEDVARVVRQRKILQHHGEILDDGSGEREKREAGPITHHGEHFAQQSHAR